MSLLILGNQCDPHAKAVQWAFASKGLKSAIFCSDGVPADSTISIDPLSDSYALCGPDVDAPLASFTVIWNRRDRTPVMPEWLHPDDHKAATGMCKIAINSMRMKNYPHQVWVNPRANQVAIDSKPNQLRLARLVGLSVPRTLISNDPERIRSFLAAERHCIAKSLHPTTWRDEGAFTVATTSPVNLEDCRDHRALRACPMIYQEHVPKLYELRIVLFGEELLCVRIDSQTQAATAVDWRFNDVRKLGLREVECPVDLRKRLLRFAHLAGIVHGSFDLVVTPDNEFVFLEINEQGQTLWIEECNPEIRVLDRLAQFLERPTAGFRYDGAREFAFADYMSTPAWRELDRELRIRERENRGRPGIGP